MSIAGSDSSAGAGIQADLRTFVAHGVYGTTAITALTAQNPTEVCGIVGIDAAFVLSQILAVHREFGLDAIKTGMLWSVDTLATITAYLSQHKEIPVVVDPVMMATSGSALIENSAIEHYRQELLPRATLATPNLEEAAQLLDVDRIEASDQQDAATSFSHRFQCSVLVKGGHGQGTPVTDVLFHQGKLVKWQHPRIEGVNTHGTGCCLSAAITAQLAHGQALETACDLAISWLQKALAHPVRLGSRHTLLGLATNLRLSKPPKKATSFL